MSVWGLAVPSSTQFKEVPVQALFLAAYEQRPPRIDRLDLLADKSSAFGGVIVDYCVLGASAGYAIRRKDGQQLGALVHSCARGVDVGDRPFWLSTDQHSYRKFRQILNGQGWCVRRTISFHSGLRAQVRVWCEPWRDRAHVQHPEIQKNTRLRLVFDFGSMRVVTEPEQVRRLCRAHPKTRITIAGRPDSCIVVHDSHDYPTDRLVVHHETVFSGF